METALVFSFQNLGPGTDMYVVIPVAVPRAPVKALDPIPGQLQSL
jgi:hypothetical protein